MTNATDWLKRMKDVPTDPKEILITAAVFSANAKIAADAKRRNDAVVTKAASALEAQLLRTQSAIFPKLRKTWAASLNQKMWEHDVEVRAFGDGYRTVELIAAVYASHSAIKSTQETLGDTLKGLRFKRVQYRWFRGADDYTYYKLDTPSDKALVTDP